MARTIHVEQRTGEKWQDVASSFMRFCADTKRDTRAGFHEGDAFVPGAGEKVYAAISVPDHSSHLVAHLKEWARLDGRAIHDEKQSA